ncbi:hypothetical protein CEXT_137001 [Caerostris extrusa]|uniref:Uncharacterized protein n=1 Tax=Caerostris extrusa TaxID=172846 RepID=A0AAV4NWM9_CAEEX|nr:hypothetical protein CEXT_137001 [Caerostris extrusa]
MKVERNLNFSTIANEDDEFGYSRKKSARVSSPKKLGHESNLVVDHWSAEIRLLCDVTKTVNRSPFKAVNDGERPLRNALPCYCLEHR